MSDVYDVEDLDDLQPDKLKMLLHGPQGHGKTTTALSIAQKKKTVVVDLPGEKGLKSVKEVPYSKNIKVIRPREVAQLDDIFWDLQIDSGPVKGAEAVIFESASAYQKMVLRMIMGNPENKMRTVDKKVRMPDQQEYGKALEFMTDLATFWFGLADITSPNPLHVIFTCQSKRTEDEDTGEIEVTLDVTTGARGTLLANPDYVGYCFVQRAETEDLTEEKWDYKVRFGPHDVIATKVHESIEANTKLTEMGGVLGGFGKKRLTIPKFCKAFGIPL
jgi:hypothetical protein